jgi:chemotaxis protein CheX
MKAEFLNPFVYAGMKVLMAEAGVTNWSLDKPYLIPMDTTRDPVNVVVGVTGTVQGLVAYGMDLAVAKAIVRGMAGAAIPITDPVAESALGELGNLITGMASSILEESGYPCRISPPAIVRGTAVRLTATTVPMVVVPMATGVGSVSIYLALGECPVTEQGGRTA